MSDGLPVAVPRDQGALVLQYSPSSLPSTAPTGKAQSQDGGKK